VTDASGAVLVPAADGDLARVARLAARCFDDPWSEDAVAGTASAPGGLLRVVRLPHGEELAGYLLGVFVAPELSVLSLAVAPELRRRGLGRALVADAARVSGALQVWLEVRAGNAGARGFYHALRFSQVATRRRYYPDGEDAVLLSGSPTALEAGLL